jgi:hypothetical protein
MQAILSGQAEHFGARAGAVQVRHRRGPGVRWAPQAAGGLFSKDQALILEAQRSFEPGEVVAMDYGQAEAEDQPKLDSQVLLDYGVLDADNAEVGLRLCRHVILWGSALLWEARLRD